MSVSVSANQWIAFPLAVVMGFLGWISTVLLVNPNTRFTTALHSRQWIALPFSLLIPILVWLRLVLTVPAS